MGKFSATTAVIKAVDDIPLTTAARLYVKLRAKAPVGPYVKLPSLKLAAFNPQALKIALKPLPPKASTLKPLPLPAPAKAAVKAPVTTIKPQKALDEVELPPRPGQLATAVPLTRPANKAPIQALPTGSTVAKAAPEDVGPLAKVVAKGRNIIDNTFSSKVVKNVGSEVGQNLVGTGIVTAVGYALDAVVDLLNPPATSPPQPVSQPTTNPPQQASTSATVTSQPQPATGVQATGQSAATTTGGGESLADNDEEDNIVADDASDVPSDSDAAGLDDRQRQDAQLGGYALAGARYFPQGRRGVWIGALLIVAGGYVAYRYGGIGKSLIKQ